MLTKKEELTSFIQDRLLHLYQNSFQQLAGEIHTRTDCWQFIPMYTDQVIKQIQFVLKNITPSQRNHVNLLDVGCGIGNILTIANILGIRCLYGVEYNKKLAQMNPWYPDIFIGDAFDYKKYSKHNIIYIYCPIRNHELMAKLEEKIEDETKVGTYIIDNLKQSRNLLKDKRFKIFDTTGFTSGFIYQKVSE